MHVYVHALSALRFPHASHRHIYTNSDLCLQVTHKEMRCNVHLLRRAPDKLHANIYRFVHSIQGTYKCIRYDVFLSRRAWYKLHTNVYCYVHSRYVQIHKIWAYKYTRDHVFLSRCALPTQIIHNYLCALSALCSLHASCTHIYGAFHAKYTQRYITQIYGALFMQNTHKDTRYNISVVTHSLHTSHTQVTLKSPFRLHPNTFHHAYTNISNLICLSCRFSACKSHKLHSNFHNTFLRAYTNIWDIICLSCRSLCIQVTHTLHSMPLDFISFF